MALTAKQDIPERPKEKTEWSMRRLFPFAGVASAVAKTFINPFDILLGYLVLILGIAELFGRKVSWEIWLLSFFILLADLAQRHKIEPPKEDKKK